MDKLIFWGVLFIFIDLAGFYFAYLYGRKTKEFRWREYIAITIFPIIGVLVLTYLFGAKVFALFIASCIVGFSLEYILGLAYHKTLNKKLWEYKRLSINGYTSLLSIPFWGVGGVAFWFLGKLIGL